MTYKKTPRRTALYKVCSDHQLGSYAACLNVSPPLQLVRQKAHQERVLFRTALDRTDIPSNVKVGNDAPSF